jgi:hypothetical protein
MSDAPGIQWRSTAKTPASSVASTRNGLVASQHLTSDGCCNDPLNPRAFSGTRLTRWRLLRWYRERRGDPGRDGQGRRLRLLADEAFGMRGVGGGEDGGTRGADGVRASVVDGLRGAQTQTGMTVLNVKSPGRIPCLASVSLMELLGERRRFSVCHRPPHDVPAEQSEQQSFDEAVSHYCPPRAAPGSGCHRDARRRP